MRNDPKRLCYWTVIDSHCKRCLCWDELLADYLGFEKPLERHLCEDERYLYSVQIPEAVFCEARKPVIERIINGCISGGPVYRRKPQRCTWKGDTVYVKRES